MGIPSYDEFKACVTQPFVLTIEDGDTLEFALISAEKKDKAYVTSADRESFSLVFRGPMEPLLAQQIFRFEHQALGSIDIFVVPIGPDDEGQRYEAVFS